MAYKVRYKPLERLARDGWIRFEPGKPASSAVATPADASLHLDTSGLLLK